MKDNELILKTVSVNELMSDEFLLSLELLWMDDTIITSIYVNFISPLIVDSSLYIKEVIKFHS